MKKDKNILLSTAYLPNIQYFSKLLTSESVAIEVCENYQKQSFRNRATILGANGPLNLVIPVKRTAGNSTKTCDVLLDYDMPWQQVHWKAIQSAYNHSPFFEIFKEELKPVFYKKEKYLIDWNFILLNLVLKITDTACNYTVTKTYEEIPENFYDYRNSIHPKKRRQKPDNAFQAIPYFQVFSDRHNFIPNLSFIDLLFNEGSQAILLCKRCAKKRVAVNRYPS